MNSVEDVFQCVRKLATAWSIVPSREAAQALLNSCVRRHGVAVAVRMHWHVETVVRTPAEMGILAAADDMLLRDQVLRCNHHYVANPAPSTAHFTAMHAAGRIQAPRESAMAQLAAEAHARQIDLAVAVGHLRALVVTYPAIVVDLPAAGVTVTQPANHDVYGTKIRAVVAYVQLILAADPAAMLVFYSQFLHLTTLLMAVLDTAHVSCATEFDQYRSRDRPSVYMFTLVALDEWPRDISHVEILHPVLDGSEVMARAAEMRAVATLIQRSDERGKKEEEERREMTVVWFVAAGTVEERLVEIRCRGPWRW
ncbi:hypothetical protein GGF31_008067 [Allomyces arbusculus]|nr:hypothetical protein GGF31_008067 [Allomyces arbusculus]